ncbi:hypothetical protein KCU97_g6584, partial [Aureobasidium melanogenum]
MFGQGASFASDDVVEEKQEDGVSNGKSLDVVGSLDVMHAQESKPVEKPSPYAYVFYATQDVYACSVLVNIHQLRFIHKTPHRIFVLITSEVSPFYFSAFEDSGATISLQTPPSLANNTEGAGYYKDCLLKLYAFKMQEIDPSLQKIGESRVEDLEKRQEEKQQGHDFEPSDYETVSTPGSKDAASPEDKEAPPAFPEIPNNKASKESTTKNHSDDNLPPTIPDSTDPSKHSDGKPHLPGGIAPPSHPSSATNTTTVQKVSTEELKKRQYYTELFSLYDQVSVLHFTAMGKPWGVNKNILGERRPEAHPLFAEQFMAWRKVAKEICATGVVVEL